MERPVDGRNRWTVSSNPQPARAREPSRVEGAESTAATPRRQDRLRHSSAASCPSPDRSDALAVQRVAAAAASRQHPGRPATPDTAPTIGKPRRQPGAGLAGKAHSSAGEATCSRHQRPAGRSAGRRRRQPRRRCSPRPLRGGRYSRSPAAPCPGAERARGARDPGSLGRALRVPAASPPHTRRRLPLRQHPAQRRARPGAADHDERRAPISAP